VPNFVSFAAIITELAHGEKSHTQSLTQLIWCPGNRSACASEQIHIVQTHNACTGFRPMFLVARLQMITNSSNASAVAVNQLRSLLAATLLPLQHNRLS